MRRSRAQKSAARAPQSHRRRLARRTARRRRRTARGGGERDALALINTISTAAKHAEQSAYSDSRRALDADNVADKVDLILQGPVQNIIPAHAELAKRTTDMLSKHERMLSAELARTPRANAKARARLVRNISEASAAVRATRERFADERVQLAAALESMRPEPDKPGRAEGRAPPAPAEDKRVSSIFRNSVGAAAAVFGMAAVSYAAYHNSSLLKSAFGTLAKPGAWGSKKTSAAEKDAAAVKAYDDRDKNMPEYA